MDGILDLGGPVALWIKDWGYLAVFVGIMLENAGIPVPGETIIVVASAFAGQGLLRVDLIYGAVVVGAVLGDNVGYWIGRAGGPPLLRRLAKLARITDGQLADTEARFRRRADWAVFFGRFVALLRIFAGPLAGMVHMPWPRFFLFNALGAVVWGAVVVGVAYKVGEHAHVLLRHMGLSLLALVLLGAAYFAFRYWRSKRETG